MDEHKTVLELRAEWPKLEKDAVALAALLKKRSGLSEDKANLSLALETGKMLSAKPDVRDIVDRWLMEGDEYLSLVAIIALGSLMILSPEMRDSTAPVLEHAVINRKWRIREAVPLALRPLAEKDPAFIAQTLKRWTAEGYPIMFRTAIEILADPSLLKKQPALVPILRDIHIKAMAEVSFHPNETGEPMELLKKVLCSSISVLAMRDPSTIHLMEEWGKSPPLRPIVRANMGDVRLRKKYPNEIADLLDFLEKGH
ncbi:MAG: DNA alkylation repair protein [Thermoplasmata archaeon]|nr:DNA alkylation repair protein [Thermoplasmata archaeon]